MYSAQLLDHFQNPRNAGELADADAIAEAANPVCGDTLRITMKIAAGKVARIQFKAKGCVASIACASVLTELVQGTSVGEAGKFRTQDIISAVGGLPPASSHAAQLAVDALSSALNRVPR